MPSHSNAGLRGPRCYCSTDEVTIYHRKRLAGASPRRAEVEVRSAARTRTLALPSLT